MTGEAGIGKTVLVSAVTEDSQQRVLWGACDPLITPRPLGPLHDVAREAGGALLAAVDGPREGVLTAALDELAGGAVLVVEDLHWADDATLDLVALLGRRLLRSPGCLILTSRSDAGPEVRRVLAALPRECVRRIEPEALSADGRRAARAARRARAVGPAHGLGRQPLLRHRGAGRARGRRPGQRARDRRAARRGAQRPRRARCSSSRP